jgi:hypothetical protein
MRRRNFIALALSVLSVTSFFALSSFASAQQAQKKHTYKRTCDEYCIRRCNSDNYARNYCRAECPYKCRESRRLRDEGKMEW